MSNYELKHFSCQLLSEQTLYPTAFFNAYLSDREKLTQKYYYERLIHGPVTEPLEIVATNLKISLSTLKRDLIKLRACNFLRKYFRGIKRTSVYVLHEFYAQQSTVNLFKAYFKTLLILTKHLYGKAQQQMNGLLIRLKVSYLYNSTINRMRERRVMKTEKPERRAFSSMGETYRANDPGHEPPFARKTKEEWDILWDEMFPKEAIMKRISGSAFDEYCVVEEKLHKGITSGTILPKAGQQPNFFANKITPAERELGLAAHIDCTCRETPEQFVQRTYLKSEAPQAGSGLAENSLKPKHILKELQDYVRNYSPPPTKRDWNVEKDLQPQAARIDPDWIEEDEWRPSTVNFF